MSYPPDSALLQDGAHMRNEDIKIITRSGRVVTLNQWYEGHRRTHKAQAKLPFEEKIRALVSLQEIARSWGGKKDVIVWRI